MEPDKSEAALLEIIESIRTGDDGLKVKYQYERLINVLERIATVLERF